MIARRAGRIRPALRSRSAARAAADTPLVHRMAAVLLRYPDEAMLACLADVEAALPAVDDDRDRARLAAACAHLRRTSATTVAQHYVAVFDHTRRRSLHLTYYRHGDTRNRGMALLTLKHAYRRAGHPPPDSDLPDFLPLVLEFAALAPEPGRRILLQCRAGLELLRTALHAYESEHAADAPTPYAGVLDVLCGRLPEPRRGERETWRKLAAEGPPGEAVGLEPFGPPEQTGLDPFGTGEPEGRGRLGGPGGPGARPGYGMPPGYGAPPASSGRPVPAGHGTPPGPPARDDAPDPVPAAHTAASEPVPAASEPARATFPRTKEDR